MQLTLHTGEAVVQIAAIKITTNDLSAIGADKSVVPLKLFLIEVDEDFQIIPTQIKLREIDCTIRTTMLLVDCLLAI